MNRVAPLFLVSCVLSFLGAAAPAQEVLSVRIETSQEGLHRVPGERIKDFFPLDRIDPERLALTHDGQPVPIEVFGGSDGHFDPSDEIIFFAEAPRKRHTATETYVLSDRGNALRFRAASSPSEVPDTLKEAQVVAYSAPGTVFDPLASVRQDIIRGPMPSPWFTAALAPKGTRARGDRSPQPADASTASIPITLEPRPMRGLPSRIRIEAFGAVANGIPQKLGVEVNGTELAAQSWDTPLTKALVVVIPPNLLRKENVVKFSNLSEVASYNEPGNELMAHKRNDLLIERFSILYDAQLVGPAVSGQQSVFRLAATEGSTPRVVRIEQRQSEGYLVVEPKSGRMWRNPVVEVPGDREVTLAVCSLGGAYLPEPDRIRAMRPTKEHLSAAGGDYVIVTTTDLKPAVAMLAEHRRADGFTPIVVEARELYDAFTFGAFHPAAIQRFLAAATANWAKKPRYLLLVGDADLDCDFLNKRETLPAWLVMTDYNGMTATDALHGDIDGDGIPDVAVGRIPVRSREDFLNVARKIIAIETGPPPGAWRHTIDFFAGEGHFGALIDTVLEKQAAAVIAKIPPQFDVQMTYANPTSSWYWPAEDFNGHLIRSFNKGALVFNYIGHGSPEAFDHVTDGSSVYPILSVKDIDALANESRSPVMTIIACSTGHYDDPNRDCLAEKMLLKDGGPVAVIAASRISHPYPNALFGKGISEPFLNPGNRVGDAFRAGTVSMVASSHDPLNSMLASAFLSKAVDPVALVRDHVYIYNLFGDPAQRLPFPLDIPGIEAPEAVKAGGTVEVKAALAQGSAGEAVVSIEARRDRRAHATTDSQPSNAGSSAPTTRAEMIKARHDAANDHAVVRGRFKIEDGAVAASLAVPADAPPGTYWVVIFVEGDATTPTAAGSKAIRIE